jgi:hypothetical protein
MSAINAADEGDILDEAAERQAFMDAVAEWRKADAADGSSRQPLRIEREYLGEKSSTKAPVAKISGGVGASLSGGDVGGGMWKNPFAPSSEVVDDTPVRAMRRFLVCFRCLRENRLWWYVYAACRLKATSWTKRLSAEHFRRR